MMLNKKTSLTKASGVLFGLVAVLVFASSSWAARMDVDNQSNCDVEVTYTVRCEHTTLSMNVPAGKKKFRDDPIYWTSELVSTVDVYSESGHIMQRWISDNDTFYHCKVTCTGKDQKSLRCDTKFWK